MHGIKHSVRPKRSKIKPQLLSKSNTVRMQPLLASKQKSQH